MRRTTQRAHWLAPLPTAGDAHRRATGRARVNADRKAEAAERRALALERARALGWPARRRGVVAQVAAALGLHRATVSRYLHPRRPLWQRLGL